MSNKRTGIYGTYIGSFYDESKALSQSEMEINATYIYKYLSAKGWTLNAIAGLLGNMQHESAINPGRWQGNNVGSGPAYGLVQWDPYTKYTDWCAAQGYADPSEMDNNLSRIIFELENHIQYYATDSYDLSFSEFSKSNESPYYLACAWAWNYEKSAVVLWGTEEEQAALREERGSSANDWYQYLYGGVTPPDPDDPDPDDPDPDEPITPSKLNKKGFNFLLFTARRRRGQWTK